MKDKFKPTPGGWERRKLIHPKVIGENAQVLCPYCARAHPLPIIGEAICGTRLEIRAIQKVYHGVQCSLCGRSQGTMVKIGGGYKHAVPCTPGKELYAEPPPASRSAALFWHSPAFVQLFIARRLRRSVVELKRAGKVVGYAWERITINDRQAGQVPG
jgi:hypothetical protein